jgi:hypothetical protein
VEKPLAETVDGPGIGAMQALQRGDANFRALLRRHPEIAESIIRQLVMKLVAE